MGRKCCVQANPVDVFNHGSDKALAIGWIAALKFIPWGTVLEAAPHIVKGAKSLIAKTKNDPLDSPTMPPASPSASSDSELANLDRRVRQIQEKVVELNAEQQSSAELIKSLAEQNAHVVKAIEVFRVRIKVLIILCVLSGGTLATLAFWVVMK